MSKITIAHNRESDNNLDSVVEMIRNGSFQYISLIKNKQERLDLSHFLMFKVS